jgi:hypothetical protein
MQTYFLQSDVKNSIEISHEELKNIKLSAFIDGQNASVAELEKKYEILLKKKDEDNGFINGENIDRPIINLKKYAISLDNRYLKNYNIVKEKNQTIINILV